MLKHWFLLEREFNAWLFSIDLLFPQSLQMLFSSLLGHSTSKGKSENSLPTTFIKYTDTFKSSILTWNNAQNTMFWKIPKAKHHMGILFIQQTKAPCFQPYSVVLGARIRCISIKTSLTDISFNWDSEEYIFSPICPGFDRIYPSCLYCCTAYPLQMKENEFYFPPGRIIG